MSDHVTCVNALLKGLNIPLAGSKVILNTDKIKEEVTQGAASEQQHESTEAVAASRAIGPSLASMSNEVPVAKTVAVKPTPKMSRAAYVKQKQDEARQKMTDVMFALFGTDEANRPLPTVDPYLVLPWHTVGLQLGFMLTEKALSYISWKHINQNQELIVLENELDKLLAENPAYEPPDVKMLDNALRQSTSDGPLQGKEAASRFVLQGYRDQFDTIQLESIVSAYQSKFFLKLIPHILEDKLHEKDSKFKYAAINLFCAVFGGDINRFTHQDGMDILAAIPSRTDGEDSLSDITERLNKWQVLLEQVGTRFAYLWESSQFIYFREIRGKLQMGGQVGGADFFSERNSNMIPRGFLESFPGLRGMLIDKAKRKKKFWDPTLGEPIESKDLIDENGRFASTTFEFALIYNYILKDGEGIQSRLSRWKLRAIKQQIAEIKSQKTEINLKKSVGFVKGLYQKVLGLFLKKNLVQNDLQEIIKSYFDQSIKKVEIKPLPEISADKLPLDQWLMLLPKELGELKAVGDIGIDVAPYKEFLKVGGKREGAVFEKWLDTLDLLSHDLTIRGQKLLRDYRMSGFKGTPSPQEGIDKAKQHRFFIISRVMDTIDVVTNAMMKESKQSYEETRNQAIYSIVHHLLKKNYSPAILRVLIHAREDYPIELSYMTDVIGELFAKSTYETMKRQDYNFLSQYAKSNWGLVKQGLFYGTGACLIIYALFNKVGCDHHEAVPVEAPLVTTNPNEMNGEIPR